MKMLGYVILVLAVIYCLFGNWTPGTWAPFGCAVAGFVGAAMVLLGREAA